MSKITSRVLLKEDNVSKLAAGIKAITERRVLVGVPNSKTDRKDGGATNAMLAYVHDQGSPLQNIPKREFMRPGIENAQAAIDQHLAAAGRAVLEFSPDPDTIDKELHAAGQSAVNGIRRKITQGPFEPLKPATLAARKARGRTGTKPLIDSAQLRNAITYVVK